MLQLVLMELLRKMNQHPIPPPPPLQKLGALQNDNDYADDDTEQKKNSQKASSFADCLENV